jgi:hypothetical protein
MDPPQRVQAVVVDVGRPLILPRSGQIQGGPAQQLGAVSRWMQAGSTRSAGDERVREKRGEPIGATLADRLPPSNYRTLSRY